MLKTNYVWTLLFIAVLLIECTVQRDIPSSYLRNPRGMDTMSNGCWININEGIVDQKEVRGNISGELIAVQSDTFYILTRKDFVYIPANEIKTATMFLFKDQSGKYILVTCLGLIPNFAGALINKLPKFLLLGIPFAVVGISTSAIEASANKYIYPIENQLDQFSVFARFPQGVPKGVDVNKLTLRIDTR